MKEYLENIAGSLNQEDWNLLISIMKTNTFAKGDLILKEGEVCKSIWYLEQGAVRYYEMIDGNEHSTHFFISPSFFTAYHSLITTKPSDLIIKAEEDCNLQILPYEKLSALYIESHKLERVGRIIAEYQFIAEFERRRMHLHMDALERYELLESTQPEVFRKFQLKDIATYLGITPESLSRLRKYRFNRPK